MPDDLLERASRCLVARRGGQWPTLEPAVFWSDGAGLWLHPTRSSESADVLADDPQCTAYVPPDTGEEAGLVVDGRMRAYGLHDPLGLVLHGPTVSTAMAALAVRGPGGLRRSVEEAPRNAGRWLRRSPVVLRLAIGGLRSVDAPDGPPGVAPALPTAVPADVRRALAGIRSVVLAFEDDGALQVTPAAWGAGYTVVTPPTLSPRPGAAVTAVASLRHRHVDVGVAVMGMMGTRQVLEPRAGLAWRGSQSQDVDVSPSVAGGVSLPD